jgi:serpin B
MTPARHAALRSVVVVALVLAACGDDAPTTTTATDAPPLAELFVERLPPDSPDAAALAAGLNEVGYDLFAHAAGEADGAGVVLSPLSIGLALGMADAGASGATADALEALFAYPVGGDARLAAFNTLEQSVTGVADATVRLANRQFPDTGFVTVDGYDETLARFFDARVEPLPLQADPEGSRARINDFVAEQTEDLIPELLPEGMVNPASVLFLVNALYLEADWAKPFGKYSTEDAAFTRLDGTEVTVPLMHELELTGPAVVTDDYAATEVPYAGDDLSMLVIVPAEGRYEAVEADLDGDLVAEVDDAAVPGPVELFLPRFESTTNLDLRAGFEGIGVDGIFDAPYDGIAPGITLESGVHAADITVDEAGTVAAAATGLDFAESGPPVPDIVVRADARSST